MVFHADDVLRAPASTLFRRGDGWHVFAAQDGRAALRPVEIGQRGLDAVEIRAGLAAGDPVVLHPSDRLADGVRIAPF